MYNVNKFKKSKIGGVISYKGETIEGKVQRIMSNKEPIRDGAPLIYTDRSEGVLPAYDIRTDRFDVAVEAMDKVTRSKLAKREAKVVNIDKPQEGDKLPGASL